MDATKAALEQEKEAGWNIQLLCNCREEATCRGCQSTEKIQAGELTGPLAGVPVAIKDKFVYRRNPDYLQFQDSGYILTDLLCRGSENLKKAGAV